MLKYNMIRFRLIDKHVDCVRHGEYELARAILRLIRNGRASVGLDDVGFALEVIAEKADCHVRYSRSFNTAYISF